MFGKKHRPSSYIHYVLKHDGCAPRYVSVVPTTEVTSSGWYQIVPTLDFNMYISFITMHKKPPLNLLMLNILCST